MKVRDRVRVTVSSGNKPIVVNTNKKHELQMRAMIYAIQNYPLINRTKLMKFIFFVDLFAYNNYGDTLLEDRYIRLPRGPVPFYGFMQTSESSKNGYFTTKKSCIGQDNEENPIYTYQFTLKQKVDNPLSNLFTPQQKDLLGLALKAVKNNSTKTVSDFTHGYSLWKETKDNEDIKKDMFKLTEYKEMHKLNNFLNTVIYVSPMNVIPNGDMFPNTEATINRDVKLPIYMNRKTGDIL